MWQRRVEHDPGAIRGVREPGQLGQADLGARAVERERAVPPIRSSATASSTSSPWRAASASAPTSPPSSSAVNAIITGCGGGWAWSSRASSISTATAAASSAAPGLAGHRVVVSHEQQRLAGRPEPGDQVRIVDVDPVLVAERRPEHPDRGQRDIADGRRLEWDREQRGADVVDRPRRRRTIGRPRTERGQRRDVRELAIAVEARPRWSRRARPDDEGERDRERDGEYPRGCG